MGEAVVGPYLWWLGARRVEHLVVSHAHPDYAGGVPFLLRAFRVGEAWEGLAPTRDHDYARLDEALGEAGVGRRSMAVGARAEWDGVFVRVLGPRPRGSRPAIVRNEDSLVLALDYGDVRLLLTGDVQGQAEDELTPGRAEVVKVPHHGSRTSSSEELVSATGARLAIVSCGARNPFGHPSAEAVARWRQAGALVLRTDRDGSVFVATDGRRVWVRAAGEGEERRIR
jgi:competence protein ComEC